MADGGWVAVQRKIQKSFVWANPFVLKLWLLCLFKASHDGNRFLFNGEEIQVDRGQFVTGRVALAKDYNAGARGEHQLSPTSINRWMSKFRELGMVDISTTARYSVVTVINYDLYQSSGQLADRSRTSSGHLADTINNANNANNANKRDSQHSRKREYADDSPEMIEAVYLWEKIKGNNPEHRKPDLQSWADDIRKMNQLDHRPFEKIHKMIDWCQIDTFWQTNILSASKLRSKYDTMAAQANRPYTSRRAPARQEATPEWMAKDYKAPKQEATEAEKAELAAQLAELEKLRQEHDA